MGLEVANSLELSMVRLINEERAKAGLDPVHVELHLNDSSQEHSDWMAQEGVLQHEGAGGSSATDRIRDSEFPLGQSWSTRENLAYVSVNGDVNTSHINQMHENLMDSPGHRANILDPDVDYVGIGLSVGTITQSGRDYEVVFATQNFARTTSEVLVQDVVNGEDVAVPFLEGEPNGDAFPVDETPVDEPDEPQEPPVIDVPDEPVQPDPPIEDPKDDEEDDEEETPQDKDSGSGGGCFVATAAYGTRNHPDVVEMRRFRDEVLVKTSIGRAFIRSYWRVGPVLAKRIRPDHASAKAVRSVVGAITRQTRKGS